MSTARRPSRWFALVCGLGLLLGLGRAIAHPLVPADATLSLDDAGADLQLTVGWHTFTQHLPDPEAADAFLEAQLRLAGPERAAWLERLRAHLSPRVTLRCDGVAIPLRLAFPVLSTPGQEALPAASVPNLLVEGAAPFTGTPTACGLALDESLGSAVLRVRRPGRFADEIRLLGAGEASPMYPMRATPEVPPVPAPSFATYVVVGFEHIVPDGLDHVLFVLALFFLGAGLRALAWQVTAFTLAHSATLAAGLLGVARLPPEVIEPAIAASIALVALEDLFARGRTDVTRRRVVVVFFFGLLHGLGFAGALSEAGLPMDDLVRTLLGFNLGVEAGQLAVLLAAALATAPLRRFARYEQLVRRPACVAIAATGLYWTVTRIF
ncbi:HupE/UreJ family protein [Myxococcota bacterium]|nr:HupE/UreJ family protein [Myxococcota bacterium]